MGNHFLFVQIFYDLLFCLHKSFIQQTSVNVWYYIWIRFLQFFNTFFRFFIELRIQIDRILYITIWIPKRDFFEFIESGNNLIRNDISCSIDDIIIMYIVFSVLKSINQSLQNTFFSPWTRFFLIFVFSKLRLSFFQSFCLSFYFVQKIEV